MNVVITDERLVKSVSVELEEGVTLSGEMIIRDGKLSDGELDVRGEKVGYVPLNFRFENGEITISPSRMSSSLFGKVYAAIAAIEEAFAEEIEAAQPTDEEDKEPAEE